MKKTIIIGSVGVVSVIVGIVLVLRMKRNKLIYALLGKHNNKDDKKTLTDKTSCFFVNTASSYDSMKKVLEKLSTFELNILHERVVNFNQSEDIKIGIHNIESKYKLEFTLPTKK